MKNNKNLVWALVALLILVVLGGWLYSADPLGWQRGSTETQQAADVETGGEQAADTSEAVTSETEPASSTEADETETAAAAGAASDSSQAEEMVVQLLLPTFDLVRVEPDGSTLIAGQATPGTAIEVVSNGIVIATVQAGSTGDFAAVVDDRLPPGDHEIVLRSTGEGDQSAQSEEIATISVPQSDPSELLVMVTKPGEASRILARPEAPEAEVATAEVQEGAETTAAAGQAADEPQAVAGATSETSTQQSTDTASRTGDAATTTAETATAQETTTTAAATDSGPAADEAAGATSTDTATAGSTSATDKPGTEMARVEPDTAETATTATAAAETGEIAEKSDAVVAIAPTLRIDAVEIENGRMFVAGSATPGGEVRVYADGEALGISNVSASGRFLVEAQKDLAVGNHTISADLIMQSGAAVAMRVAVPFNRPEGQTTVAAVAAPAQEPDTGTETAAQETASVADEPASATSQSTQTTTETNLASSEQTSGGTEAQSAETASASQEQAGTAAEKAPRVATAETGTVQNAPAEQGSAGDTVSTAADTQTEIASADTGGNETTTIVQPALEQRDSSVIIRRGDTLWQISRRVYGRGVRYTTIYLANEDQIQNPDMIEPGQIFAVPDEPLENAEELHRQRILRR